MIMAIQVISMPPVMYTIVSPIFNPVPMVISCFACILMPKSN